MKLYIPKDYQSRTEYRILGDWHDLVPISFEGLAAEQNLQTNILVLVGRLLKKLSTQELSALQKWSFQEGRQLLCLPSWRPLKLDELFNLDISLEVVRNSDLQWQKYDFYSLDYEVKSTVQQGDKIKTEAGNLLAISYKKHQHSGVLTITTLPLLDMSLLTQDDIIKEQFDNLLIKEQVVSKKSSSAEEEKSLSEAALYILLLAAAEIDLSDNLKEKINKYLYQQYNAQKLKKEVKTLIEQGFLQNNQKISNKGKKHIKHRGYVPYVREIKHKKSDANDRY
ncbi:MAG: hypothetical protein ACQEP9_03795 [Bacillota bacterium]